MRRFEFTSDSTVEIHATSSVHPIDGETHAIRGRADIAVEGGRVALDPPPSGYLELPVEALESGHGLQDREMRRRIEAKRYPVIRFDLKEAVGGPERFTVTGTVTFHGVTRDVTDEVTARIDGDALHVEGTHTFDIRDFGVKPPKILTLQVYPEVRIVARLVGVATERSA